MEHLEVINHREAILFLEEMINNNEPLTEWNIKSIHALILKEIDNQNAGRYRMENMVIGGAVHIPPKHFEIYSLMQNLILEYNEEWKSYHPVLRATLLHGEFVKIHPFIDGNGRTSRLLLNFELMKNGYTPIIIKNTGHSIIMRWIMPIPQWIMVLFLSSLLSWWLNLNRCGCRCLNRKCRCLNTRSVNHANCTDQETC